MTSLILLVILSSERQAEVSDENCAYQIYSSWYFIMAHTLWGNSTNAAFVCHFEWQFVNVSILHRDHLIISSNMVVEARILIRYLSTLYQRFRRPDYSTWRRAHVNLWRNDREFQRHTYWNLQFIHDRLDGYVPNHIFSTTLARIHRRQSFIFYASHAAEHNMTMEITTTNGHRLPLRSPSAIILRSKDFLNFFLFSRRLWLHSHSTGVPVTWYFRTCFLWDHILRGCTKLHIWTTLQLSQCSRKAVSVCSVLSKSTLD